MITEADRGHAGTGRRSAPGVCRNQPTTRAATRGPAQPPRPPSGISATGCKPPVCQWPTVIGTPTDRVPCRICTLGPAAALLMDCARIIRFGALSLEASQRAGVPARAETERSVEPSPVDEQVPSSAAARAARRYAPARGQSSRPDGLRKHLDLAAAARVDGPAGDLRRDSGRHLGRQAQAAGAFVRALPVRVLRRPTAKPGRAAAERPDSSLGRPRSSAPGRRRQRSHALAAIVPLEGMTKLNSMVNALQALAISMRLSYGSELGRGMRRRRDVGDE
jgi:hypothetical protein